MRIYLLFNGISHTSESAIYAEVSASIDASVKKMQSFGFCLRS